MVAAKKQRLVCEEGSSFSVIVPLIIGSSFTAQRREEGQQLAGLGGTSWSSTASWSDAIASLNPRISRKAT